ncbi:MAG: hypothetical protein Q4P72_06265 [Eubacteriales bacterium]|nr:hypothetical protein [Eubacteriales bacterium]
MLDLKRLLTHLQNVGMSVMKLPWLQVIRTRKKLLLALLGAFILSQPFHISTITAILMIISLGMVLNSILGILSRRKHLRNARQSFLRFLQEASSRIAVSISIEQSIIQIAERFRLDYGEKDPTVIRLESIASQIQHRRALSEVIELLKATFPCPESKAFFSLLNESDCFGEDLLLLFRRQEDHLRNQINEIATVEAENSRQRSEALLMALMPFLMLRFLRSSNRSFYDPALRQFAGQLCLLFAFVLALAALVLAFRILFSEGRKRKSAQKARRRKPPASRLRREKKVERRLLKAKTASVRKLSKSEILYAKALNRRIVQPQESAKNLIFESMDQSPLNSEKPKQGVSELLNRCAEKLRQLYGRNQVLEIKRRIRLKRYQQGNDEWSSSLSTMLDEYFRKKALLFLIALVAGTLLLASELPKFLFCIPAVAILFVQDLELKMEIKEIQMDLMIDFPPVISLLSILSELGFSNENAARTVIRTIDGENIASQILREAEMQQEFELDFSKVLFERFQDFQIPGIDRCISALLRFHEDGDPERARNLDREARDAFKLYTLSLRSRTEQAHSRLLIPMALSLLSIMAMAIAPLFSTFLSGGL